ncbi:MAG: ABC transporter substrate-binding protein [Anaerolineae bacterium]|nr:ABC transporter substrate-binding protein [Anaerolineae bacterium]
MKPRILVLFIFMLVIGLTFPAAAQDTNLLDACVETYDAAFDYFPEKITIDNATGFTVEYFNNYKVVTVTTPWSDATDPIQYVLVQCGTPTPESFVDAKVLEVPVQSIVTMSTSILPHLDAQGVLDKLVGIDTMLYTSNQTVIDAVAAGDIVEVGGSGAGTETNVEQLIDMQPDLIMTQRYSSSDTSYPALEATGLPVVINADFLDASPLGVAEWGKFISLFFNSEGEAQAQFEIVQSNYETLKALVADVETRPTVFSGTPYEGSWFMPGGQSYLAQLLADSGAAYLWADDTTIGSIPLDFETVFDTAIDADYWVNVLYLNTLADVQAMDERFIQFKAFQDGNIFSNGARQNGTGGLDYYEAGYANPDVILADLVKIFHPDLLADHELYFYKQLDSASG